MASCAVPACRRPMPTASSWRRGRIGSRATPRRRPALRRRVEADGEFRPGMEMDLIKAIEAEVMEEADDEALGESLRRCVVTRAVLPKAALVRFVVGPTGEIVPDVAARLPGRGLWVKAERA